MARYETQGWSNRSATELPFMIVFQISLNNMTEKTSLNFFFIVVHVVTMSIYKISAFLGWFSIVFSDISNLEATLCKGARRIL